MIDDEIHHQLHISLLELSNENVDVFVRAIDGINLLIVRNIISHIYLWGFVDWECRL